MDGKRAAVAKGRPVTDQPRQDTNPDQPPPWEFHQEQVDEWAPFEDAAATDEPVAPRQDEPADGTPAEQQVPADGHQGAASVEPGAHDTPLAEEGGQPAADERVADDVVPLGDQQAADEHRATDDLPADEEVQAGVQADEAPQQAPDGQEVEGAAPADEELHEGGPADEPPAPRTGPDVAAEDMAAEPVAAQPDESGAAEAEASPNETGAAPSAEIAAEPEQPSTTAEAAPGAAEPALDKTERPAVEAEPPRPTQEEPAMPVTAADTPVPADASVAAQDDATRIHDRLDPADRPTQLISEELAPPVEVPDDRTPTEPAPRSVATDDLYRPEATLPLAAAGVAGAAAASQATPTEPDDATRALSEEERKLAAERAARREARQAALAASDAPPAAAPEPVIVHRRNTDRFLGSLGLFLLRLVTAAIMLVRGLEIVTNIPAAQASFAQTRIPEPGIMAIVTGVSALLIAVALVFGLFVRVAGLGITLIAAGALVFVLWGPWSPFVQGRSGFVGELELILAAVGILFMTVGGGGFGLDRSFRKSREKDRLAKQQA